MLTWIAPFIRLFSSLLFNCIQKDAVVLRDFAFTSLKWVKDKNYQMLLVSKPLPALDI